MQPKMFLAAAAIVIALAGCGREESETASSGATGTAPAPSQATTPSTPANIGPPQSSEERREGANPVQQQVDPKENAQRRDFQQPAK